jgi:hypothetical protein
MNSYAEDDENGLTGRDAAASLGGENFKAPILRAFTVCTGLVHLGSGIATLVLNQDKKAPLFEPWLAWPSRAERLNAETNQFIPGSKYAGSISFQGLVAAFFFLSFAFQTIPALVNPIWRWQLGLLLERNIQPLRWLEYSVSASVMFLIFFILNGQQNVYLLVTVFALSFVLMMLGLVSEASAYFQRTVEYLSNEKKKRNALDFFLPHVLGWVPFTVLWALIFRSFVMGINHGKNSASSDYAKPPWWVYGVFGSQIILMGLFGANQLWQLVNLYNVRASNFKRQAEIALRSEYVYVFLSLTAKSILAWFLYGGFRSMGSTKY